MRKTSHRKQWRGRTKHEGEAHRMCFRKPSSARCGALDTQQAKEVRSDLRDRNAGRKSPQEAAATGQAGGELRRKP